MLDVHPPHESAHSWKDFLIHIATIVVGLLIALMLAPGVEALRHRHVLHVAEDKLHAEINENRELLGKDERPVDRRAKTILHNLDILNAQRMNASVTDEPKFNWYWSGTQNSALGHPPNISIFDLLMDRIYGLVNHA